MYAGKTAGMAWLRPLQRARPSLRGLRGSQELFIHRCLSKQELTPLALHFDKEGTGLLPMLDQAGIGLFGSRIVKATDMPKLMQVI